MSPRPAAKTAKKPPPGAKKQGTGPRVRKSRAAPARAYHHGDLRRALMAAGEAELAEKGVEGFTLRACARRAGVSHAAPAHHFRDTRALLTALATEGFQRFTAAMRARQKNAGADAQARFVGAGLGYVDFALANPGLFRLMFASDNPDPDDAAARAAGDESFAVLLDAVADVHGRDPRDNPELMVDVAAAWSVVHGLANLLLAGRLSFIAELPEAQYEAALVRMIEGALRKR